MNYRFNPGDLGAPVEIRPVEMIGESQAFASIRRFITKLAASDVPVFIYGASGTGKEVVARAIHQQSRRIRGSFVPIYCGAIPHNLVEAELFGHEKGAFIGAHQRVKGIVERAQKGTLFIDEVSELPLLLQVKLLRFLKEFTFQRVGGNKAMMADVRIISASNSDLRCLVKEGRFREDLYYRLNVIPIYLPPLAERDNDILLMAKVFLERYAVKSRKYITGFTPEALKLLMIYTWPGNVRELMNCIRRAVVLCETTKIGVQHLRLANGKKLEEYKKARAAADGILGMSLREARAIIETNLLAATINKCQGRANDAAKILKISRSMMYRLMKKYELKNPPPETQAQIRMTK